MNWNIKRTIKTSVLLLIFGACVFWIVRLELKAAVLTSRIDDLHNSLKQNKDQLANLESFWREVNKSGITLDKNGGTLYKGDSKIYWNENNVTLTNKNKEIGIDVVNDWVYLKNGDFTVQLGDIAIGGIHSKGIRLQIGNGANFAELFMNNEQTLLFASEDKQVRVGVTGGTGGQKSSVLFTKDGAKIELEPEKNFHINLSRDENRIELVKDNCKIVLGDGDMTSTTSGVTSPTTGAFIQESTVGSIGIAKDKGIAIKNIDDNGISISAGEDFKILLRPKDNVMTLTKDESEIQIGNTNFGEGVAFGETTTGTFAVVKGKGIAIKTAGTNEMRISGEDKLVIDFKGNIDINAWGDLNLNSLNGNVNLVGKRINFNE